MDDFLVEARTLAQRDYDPAVARWLATHEAPDAGLLNRLAATTGIGVPHWSAQFNMGPGYYRVNYFPGTLLGRYDSRVTSAGVSNPSVDPSSDATSSSFATAITPYLANTLGFTTPSSYVMLSNAIQAWGFEYNGRPVPDVVPDLAAALTLNPRLQVLVANGVHDLATPFYATEQDLSRLGGNPNVQVRNYVGGHMTYLDDTTRVRQRADLGDFYRRALQ
jgi:carboxypeptidase C (cathepsin A)